MRVGELLQKKTIHTIINPIWNDQKIAEEIAIAQANKILRSSSADLNPLDGYTQNRAEWRYISTFSDGTPVDIIIRSVDEAWIKNVITGEFTSTNKAMHTSVIMINP